MIPARVAIRMQENGWILRNDIIWHKPNGLPASVKDRLTNKHEHLFHFVKSKRYYYDLDAIRVPHASLHSQGQSKRVSEGRSPHTRRHLIGLREAGKGYVRHPSGKNPGDVLEVPAETRTLAALAKHRGLAKVPWGSGWIGHPPGEMARILREKDRRWLPANGKNPGDFWTIATRPFPEAHFAVYPEALCEQPIKAACPPAVCGKCGMPRYRISEKAGYAGRKRRDDGHPRDLPGLAKRENRSPWGEKPIYVTRGWTSCDCKAGCEPGIVFDPFAGSGTTLVVAKRLGRAYLGCDLNPSYVKLASRRLARTPAAETRNEPPLEHRRGRQK